jgi:hypothetical protein
MSGLLLGLGAASGLVPREEAGADGAAHASDARPDQPEDRRDATPVFHSRPDPRPDSATPPDLTRAHAELPQPASPRSSAPDPRAASSQILLEPLAPDPNAVTAGITGIDTGAPRELVLWRLRAGRAHRLGSAVSDSNARIHAPQLPLPADGIELVATPVGVRPGGPGASEPVRLVRAPLETSQAEEIR